MIHVPVGDGTLREVSPPPHPGEGRWEVKPVSRVAPADSRELVPLQVTRGAVPVVEGLSVSISTSASRRDWRAVEREGNVVGVRLGGRARGSYVVAVRHVSGVVLDAGRLIVT